MDTHCRGCGRPFGEKYVDYDGKGNRVKKTREKHYVVGAHKYACSAHCYQRVQAEWIKKLKTPHK